MKIAAIQVIAPQVEPRFWVALHALEWARIRGYRAMQFNAVVQTDASAVARWGQLGFSIIGTVPGAFVHPEHELVGLHVMHRFLESAGAPVPLARSAPEIRQ